MKKKQLARIAKGYCLELMLSSEKLLPGFSIGAVHRYRVQYKKLRAFLRMLRTGSTASGYLRLPKQLKTVYGLAGSIRDLQLHKQQVQYIFHNKQKKPESYLLKVKQEIANSKKALRDYFSETNLKGGTEKIIQALPESFSKKALYHYTNKQWEQVAQLVATKHITDANMHLIRKILKDLYYNMTILDEARFVVKAGKQQRFVSLQLFSALMGQLGKFQDLTTEIRMLGPSQLKGLPAEAQGELQLLRATFIMQKNKQKRELARQFEKLLGAT
ncbi:MAG: CHAD domain-containing protein [Sediminibacterium sp.]|nr:CHAD domain-containing protein [Sediminibacterium sp.]